MRLGVDVGSVRVGVARSDPDGILATPVETLAREAGTPPAPGDPDVEALAALVAEHLPSGWSWACHARSPGTKGPLRRPRVRMLPWWRRASPRSGCDSWTSA